MKRFLIGLTLISFLISADTEIGRYQLETTTYTSKKGIIYVIETTLDTKTGKVIAAPERIQIPENINEQLIVELYSK